MQAKKALQGHPEAGNMWDKKIMEAIIKPLNLKPIMHEHKGQWTYFETSG